MATTTEAAKNEIHVVQELKRPYVLVLVLLAVVTVAEVQIPNFQAWFGIGQGVQIGLLMLSSIAKASLVGLYYMHLRYEPRIIRLLPVAPLVFVVLLVIIVILH